MDFDSIPTKITGYFKEMVVEVKKVTWPSREQTINYTLIVVGISLIVAAFLGTIDFALTSFVQRLIIR